MNQNRPRQFPYPLFILLLALDVIVFLIEKTASIRASGQGIQLAASYLGQPWIWAVLALKLCQLRTWTAILGRVNISLAFPLTSLAFPVAMLAATLVLGERLEWQVWLGGLLITAGAAVMGPGDADAHGDVHPAASPEETV
jgi:drug/metabolite transporter (DMT)-like permease